MGKNKMKNKVEKTQGKKKKNSSCQAGLRIAALTVRKEIRDKNTVVSYSGDNFRLLSAQRK